jgi:hypothetical protein
VTKPQFTLRLFVAALCVAAVTHAQALKKNPTSKIYVAETNGDTQIDNGKEIVDLTRKSVYNAQGTVIETKDNSNASMVLSNGTGIYFDGNTRVEIRGFSQESFSPNRSDMEDEPSVSTTHLFIDFGVIGISTSKLAAGSTTVYDTSLASATIRGRQAVIQAGDNFTQVSMIQGDATVQAGAMDLPHLVKSGQQALVRPGKPGEPNVVIIQDIPPGNEVGSQQWIGYRFLMADDARKLVYFEVQAGTGSAITVFDGADAADNSNNEIVAVPVVPENPPVGTTVSAANLTGR